jgi:uncharacterized membrane protein
MHEVLVVALRWFHIASVATLVGGLLYGRLVLRRGAELFGSDSRNSFEERAAASFRPLVYAAVVALIVSGVYNIFANPGHSPRYHMLLGIKLLLVAHVFAVSLLAVRRDRPGRAHLMASGAVSGFIIIAISAYLRRIF